MHPSLIYVSGPYTAEGASGILANVHWAMGAGSHIFSIGHFPYIPHLYHFFDEWCRNAQTRFRPEYEHYMALDIIMVGRCAGLLLLGRSPGAMRELKAAQDLGLPIWLDPLQIPAAVA